MKNSFLILILASATVTGGNESRSSTYDKRLSSLREKMEKSHLDAYIIPTEGDHHGEFLASPDLRKDFISGFTGSRGDIVVTLTKALLWTDSRYFIQAEHELPFGWTLMKLGDPEVEVMEVWLRNNLKKAQKVGVDPKKVTYEVWNQINLHLSSKGIELVNLDNNLIDQIWTDRPSYPTTPIYVHDFKFSGQLYPDKMKQLREKMASLRTDLFVVSALDEVAWLLNLRGHDLPTTPVFISYLLISPNSAYLFIHKDKISQTIVKHLSDPFSPVEVVPYSHFWNYLDEAINGSDKVLLPSGKTGSTSYAIYRKVPKEKFVGVMSPIVPMKSYKNRIEVQGSRNAHLRDAVALCELFRLLEAQVPNDIYWDELKVSEKLKELRSAQKWNKGMSFTAIVAFGKNGASPHYMPTPETNTQINTNGLLTIDSGGQYLDGTIDTTRVLHFGTPSDKERTIYTSLLQGVADSATTIFPDGTPESSLAFILRRPLLQLGLTFGHGTTHGTGVFLEVHESYDGVYRRHFIGSQEPGYYKKGEFGMRLENLVVVEDAHVQKENSTKKLLKFDELTLVPYEPKLIDVARMDKSQINWLNEYHERVRLHVGSEMVRQNRHDLYKWLVNKTAPIYPKNYENKWN